MNAFHTKLKSIMALILLSGLLAGCSHTSSTHSIQPGDEAMIHYTCRLKDGAVVATTHQGIGEDDSQKKSSVYLPPKQYKAIRLVAVSQDRSPYLSGDEKQFSFEEHIAARISKKITGMKAGETQAVTLRAEPMERMGESRYHRMNRIRRRPKEIRMKRDAYVRLTGKDPEVGLDYSYGEGFMGKVVSVSGNEILINVSAKPKTKLKTPFGPAIIEDKGNHYEVVIKALEGTPVRVGHRVGRIVKTHEQVEKNGLIQRIDTERIFTIDFAQSFGGEPLNCEVTVESVERQSEKSVTLKKDREIERQ